MHLFFIGDFERQNLEHLAVGCNQLQLVGERSPVCTFRQLVEHFLRKKVLEADFAAVHAQIACLSVCVHGKQGHGSILAQDTSGVFLARGDFHAAEVVGDFVTIGRKEFLFRIDGNFRVPESWKLYYKDGKNWKEVEALSPYTVDKDRYNGLDFKPVRTTGLKLAAQLQKGASGGVIEWKVE